MNYNKNNHMRIINNFKTLFLFGIFLFTINSNYAQTIASKIDKLLEKKYKANEPGTVVLVAKNGKVIYRKAFGKSNLELNAAMKPENIFQIGSLTKQFTAIAILMLKEQGKLKLTDEITKFIPEYPTHSKKITIHHLLTHTSGIKSYTSVSELNKKAKEEMSPLELIDLFKNEPMDFSPGEAYRYNNSGYFILGYIIEKISGQSYEDFIQKRIFDKLGMTSSLYGSHTKIINNRAAGYSSSKNGYRNTGYISLTYPYAAGSIMSNVDDLLKWQNALTNNNLIKATTLKEAFTNYTLNNGKHIFYGYGWYFGAVNGVKSIEHGGSIPGFLSHAIYIPSTNVYVAMLTNCRCNSPVKTAIKIAAIANGNAYPKLKNKVSLTQKQLKKWVGAYQFKNNIIRFITFKKGQLYSQIEKGNPYKIIPVSKNTFLFEDGFISYTFSEKKGKKIATFKNRTGSHIGLEINKKAPVEVKFIKVDKRILKQYVGKYQMKANFNIEIIVKGNQIFAQGTGQPQFEMFAKTKKIFFLKKITATIIFNKNKNGEIMSFTLQQGGRDMTLKKVLN